VLGVLHGFELVAVGQMSVMCCGSVVVGFRHFCCVAMVFGCVLQMLGGVGVMLVDAVLLGHGELLGGCARTATLPIFQPAAAR
jgi:hypothetical protein